MGWLGVERARGGGSSPVRDRPGQRADQFTGRRRTLSAGNRDGGAASAADAGASAAARAGARSLTDSRSGGLSSSREGGSSWTSSATSIRSAPRIPSIRARSPSMAARAATRSSMRARRACSSTCAVRSRAKSCGCTSRPTSTAAAMSSGCARPMAATAACWPGRPGRPSWTTNNMPNTIDFESPMAFPSIRQAQLRWTQKLSAKVSWSAAVEDNKSTITPPAGVPGKAEYPMPDLVTRFRFDGLARPRLRLRLSRPGALPSDGGRAGRRDALGHAILSGTDEDGRQGLPSTGSSPSAKASAATAGA